VKLGNNTSDGRSYEKSNVFEWHKYSKRVIRMWKMMIGVVVQDFREPTKML
jgi:hypothetical protein